ncbi:MAG: aminotransferase class IV [Myxococcota bacterium]
MTATVMMNGELCAPEDATVSIFDRGFLYGDSVYEVLRVYGGVPFELGRHLERLEASAERIGMRLSASREVFAREVRDAVAASGRSEAYIRVVATRGQGPIGLDPGLAESPLRIVVVMSPPLPPPEAYVEGAKVSVVGVRRNLREAIDPQAKTGNYLNSVLALAEARRAGAYEAIMLDAQGRVTEGASSNVFAVMGPLVLTPPLEVGLLAGITRRAVMEVCAAEEVKVLELPLTEESLRAADELFITSSIREIVPVVRVDDHVVGDGRPGPRVTALREAFARHVRARCALGA